MADDGDSTTVLEAAYLGSYKSLRFALFRGTKSTLPLTITMKATIKAWEAANKLSPSQADISPSSPLSLSLLPHFYGLPDPMVWMTKGIKTVEDTIREGELLTFNQLKTRHDLPNAYYFRFLQLRHAFQVQFRELGLETQPSAVEKHG